MTLERDRHQRFFRTPAILVIDDEEGIRFALSRLLESGGYAAHTAASGQEGLDFIEQHPFQIALCICDFKMAGLDGIETLSRMRERDPDVLRVLLTGYATLDAAIEATNQGLDAFLTKPYRVRELRTKLDELLAKRRAKLAAELLGSVPLLRGLKPEALAEIYPSLRPLQAKRGEVIQEVGDATEQLFLVESGEVRLEARGPDGKPRVIAHIGPGEHFGEAAITLGERSALRAVAALDCELLALGRADFDRLKEKHPQVAQATAQTLTRRLHGVLTAEHTPALAVAVAGPPGCARALAQALSGEGADTALLELSRGNAPGEPAAIQRLSRERQQALAVYAGTGAPPASFSEAEIVRALGGLRQEHRVVVVELPAQDSAAAAKARMQADRLVTFDAKHRPQLFAAHIETLAPDAQEPPIMLPVPEAEATAGGPAMRRVARRLLGTSLGIALGAGGARGFAHLGVLRAFAKAGVEVDAIAGASIGACVGGALAAGWTVEDITGKFAEWTVPPDVPFAEPRHVTVRKRVHEWCRERSFEEAAIPFVCNATDLVTGDEEIFDSGPLAPPICASMATPGLFPPYFIAGRCYSDAALVNGLPADLLHDRGHALIAAVDVYGHNSKWEAPPEKVPGWRRMVEAGLPGISRKVGNVRVVIRALTLAARHLVRARFTAADATIRPDMHGSMTRFSPARYGEYLASGEEAAGPAAHDMAQRRAVLMERWRKPKA